MESGGHTPPVLASSMNGTPVVANATANGSSLANGTIANGSLNGDHATATAKPTPRTKICVYCGSSPGNNPAHMEAARELARVMAANDIDLVYGGGTVGLMGEVAKTLCALSGPDAVHGIIPEALVKYERDGTYQTTQKSPPRDATNSNGTTTTTTSEEAGLAVPTEELYGRTTVVRDMHTRKQLMAQEVFAGGPGSGFIALSGGYGTLEEVLETATWNQLGIHSRGICLLNIDGFYDGLLGWIRRSADEGFIHGSNADIIATADSPAGAIAALRDYKVSQSTLKLEWGTQ